MSAQKYRVFKRRPWKRNPSWPGGWEPFGGARKRTVDKDLTIDEARRLCEQGNKNVERKPGCILYEFESM
jgi:hypothetical protein